MSNENNNAELSKSKKKRMKRNKAKAKRDAEPVKTTTDNSNTNAALNPHEKLCHALMQHGYAREEIEGALEEMWNFGMQYDSYSAARAYLEGKEAQKEADALREAIAEKEAAIVELAEGGVAVTTTDAVWEGQTNAEFDSGSENITAAPSSVSESSSQPPANDLASKLDVVANFPVLYDAVFALSEWTTKAAKPHELMELCTLGRSATPPAVYTIIRRSIECKVDSEFRSLLPSIEAITVALLGKTSISTVSSSLSDILASVRDAVEQTQSNPMDGLETTSFVEATVKSVATQICKSFELALSHGPAEGTVSSGYNDGEKNALIQNLENEIDSLLDQQPASGDGVVELMTRRDCRKQAAEKASMIGKLLFSDVVVPLSNGNGHSVEKRLDGQSKQQLHSDLFNGNYHMFQQSRTLFSDLESRLSSVNSAWSLKRSQISGELKNCEAEALNIDVRKKALQMQLDELNRELNNISARETQLKDSLDMIYNASSGAEIDGLKTEHQKRAGHIKVEEQLSSVVDKLVFLEDSMSPALAKKNGTQMVLDSMHAESKLESLLILSKNYFSTEADCVDFMTTRVVGIQMEAKELQREIAECSALGMATNVSKMTSSLETFRRNILEDQGVISALQQEAEGMRDDLIERTEDFKSAGNVLSASLEAILGSIGALLTRIRLDASNPLFTPSPILQTKPIGTSRYGSSSQPVSNPVTKSPSVQPPVEKASALMPKFSWAARSASKKAGGKSLVDIQKEEMTKQG